jgi:outer membrane protein
MRSQLVTITIVAGMILGCSGALVAAEPPSTLGELVRAAIATHEEVQRAESQIRRAQADVRLVSSALYPRVDLNAMWTRYGDAQGIEFAPGEFFEIRPVSDWNWSADLRQTLFYGLRDWRARNVALLQRDIARLERTTTINDLTLDVAAAFYSTVAAEQGVEVAEIALEAIEGQLRVAERRFEVGEVALADVARWRSEVAAAKQRLVVTQGNAALSRNRLARLVGAPELGELTTLGPIPIPPGEDNALMDEALQQRLEMLTLRHQMESAGLMIKIRKGGWLPELEAHAQYFQQKSIFPSEDWTSISLNLKVPVYDGGLTKSQVAKAKEDLREVELLEQEVVRFIRDQVDSAVINFRSATAALEAAEERTRSAREAFRQVEHAYRVGEASSIDLLDATREATDAENTHIISRNQREFEAIALRHAVGLTPLPDVDPTQIAAEDERS